MGDFKLNIGDKLIWSGDNLEYTVDSFPENDKVKLTWISQGTGNLQDYTYYLPSLAIQFENKGFLIYPQPEPIRIKSRLELIFEQEE